jgi:hypothetical protein
MSLPITVYQPGNQFGCDHDRGHSQAKHDQPLDAGTKITGAVPYVDGVIRKGPDGKTVNGQLNERLAARIAELERELAARRPPPPTAREALADRIRPSDENGAPSRALPSINKVQEVVARRWGVTPEGLRSKARIKTLTVPRQIAMFLARDLLQNRMDRPTKR